MCGETLLVLVYNLLDTFFISLVLVGLVGIFENLDGVPFALGFDPTNFSDLADSSFMLVRSSSASSTSTSFSVCLGSGSGSGTYEGDCGTAIGVLSPWDPFLINPAARLCRLELRFIGILLMDFLDMLVMAENSDSSEVKSSSYS